MTANAWQSLIAKIMPANRRGTFFGMQGAAANLLFAVGALGSGFILQRLPSPSDFVLTFMICGVFMTGSGVFLKMTREETTEVKDAHIPRGR